MLSFLWGFDFCFQATLVLISAQTQQWCLTGAETTNNIVSVTLSIQTTMILLTWMFLHIKLLQMFVISPPRIQYWFQRRRTSFSHSVITEEWKHLCNHFWTVILDKHPACIGSKGTNPPPPFFFVSQHFVFQLLAKFTPWNLRNTITLAS